MDTRWTKYKFTKLNKALCVITACILAVAFSRCFLTAVEYGYFFGVESLISGEKSDFYHTDRFFDTFRYDTNGVFRKTNYNADRAEYNAEKEKYIDEEMTAYRDLEAQFKLPKEDIHFDSYGNEFYISLYEYERFLENNGDADFTYTEISDGYSVSSVAEVYQGDDGNYYARTFEQSGFTTTSDINSGVDFGHTDADARYIFESSYDTNKSVPGFDEVEIDSISNVKYYAENDDGTVVSNVEDKDAFIDSIGSDDKDYIVYDRGNFYSSENVEDFKQMHYDLPDATRTDTVVYITINPHFSAQDKYSEIYTAYNAIGSINTNVVLAAAIILIFALTAFAVISVRLAGNTENGIKTSVFDKIPTDLYFVVTGGLIAAIVCGVLIAVSPFSYYFWKDTIFHYFANSGKYSMPFWYESLIAAAFVAVYLILVNFAASVARNVKAGRSIFKNTLIFMLLRLLVILAKSIAKSIAKFFRKTGRVLKNLVFKPQKLAKSSVRAVLLFTLYNALSIPFIILLTAFFLSDSYYDILGFVFAVVSVPIFITVDVLILCKKVIPYIKALDAIIAASERGGSIKADAEQFPESLKILADSLESTNAELQAAVVKAVKDERTKTELITNVSHDLKTPLTSVINYIDLLKKCDIKDETALKYMGVIDEKSIKLKRLIEDLIEASKVSSGNVTLNKTKLDLGELATQAIVEETADIEKSNLKIVFEEPTEKHIVFADGMKIYRVFENLLSNARKYSASGSRVYARIYSDSNFGYFEIKNISREPLNISAEELTERFVRGDKARNADGNGLGLSIAKELCRLNGGELILAIDGDLFKAVVKLPKGYL